MQEINEQSRHESLQHYDMNGASHEPNSPEDLESREYDDFDNSSDRDSAIEDDRESLWTSLKSEARNFRFENGRRYHAFREGRYMHPNDEQEANREDTKHHATLLLYKGKLHHAPIGAHPQKILDIGTGTGIWAVDIADFYPSAEVMGVDLSPIQPLMTPPNLTFEIDDVESDWLWPGYPPMNALKTGAWIEITEMDILPTSDDGTVTSEYQLNRYFEILKRAAGSLGLNLSVAPEIKDLIANAGYTNITENIYKLPLGPWPADQHLRTVGLYHREQFLNGIQGIILKYLVAVEGWQAEDVEVFLDQVKSRILDKDIHCYWKIYNVYGQK